MLAESFPLAGITECENGSEAIERIRLQKPDISLLDINMPLMNGLEVCRIIEAEKLSTRPIILTMYNEKEVIKKAMLQGVWGYLVKDTAIQEITRCIKCVMSGEKYIGPAINEISGELSEAGRKKMELQESLKNLSQAELKTLKLVSQNKSSKEIAGLLFLSEKTIENYRSRICQKLNLPPRNNSLLHWVSEHRDLLGTISEF